MRIIVTTLIGFALLISPLYGAGLGTVDSEVGSDMKYYNKGVKLMLKKRIM